MTFRITRLEEKKKAEARAAVAKKKPLDPEKERIRLQMEADRRASPCFAENHRDIKAVSVVLCISNGPNNTYRGPSSPCRKERAAQGPVTQGSVAQALPNSGGKTASLHSGGGGGEPPRTLRPSQRATRRPPSQGCHAVFKLRPVLITLCLLRSPAGHGAGGKVRCIHGESDWCAVTLSFHPLNPPLPGIPRPC